MYMWLPIPWHLRGEDHTYQLAMYKDITQELDIQLSNDMLFKYNLDGIMLTKPNSGILQANQSACEILGMSEEEIIKRGSRRHCSQWWEILVTVDADPISMNIN